MIKGGRNRDRLFSRWTRCEGTEGTHMFGDKQPKWCPATLSWAHGGREHVKKVKGLPRSDTKKTQNQNLKNPTRATTAHALV